MTASLLLNLFLLLKMICFVELVRNFFATSEVNKRKIKRKALPVILVVGCGGGDDGVVGGDDVLLVLVFVTRAWGERVGDASSNNNRCLPTADSFSASAEWPCSVSIGS